MPNTPPRPGGNSNSSNRKTSGGNKAGNSTGSNRQRTSCTVPPPFPQVPLYYLGPGITSNRKYLLPEEDAYDLVLISFQNWPRLLVSLILLFALFLISLHQHPHGNLTPNPGIESTYHYTLDSPTSLIRHPS